MYFKRKNTKYNVIILICKRIFDYIADDEHDDDDD